MPNRYICSVLEEIRNCHKSRNYSYLKGLIDEAQTLVNRMEAALEDKKDIERYREMRSELRKEIKELQKKRHELGGPKEDTYL